MAEIVIGQSCPVRSNCTPLPENPVPAMAYVPYALVAAVVIVTAVLLAVFFRKKRGR